MKKMILYIILCTCIGFFTSCEKESPKYASINVINASVGAGAIKINYFGKPLNWSTYTGTTGIVGYGLNQVLSVFNQENSSLYIVPATDTLNVIYNEELVLDPNGVYSLYTTGDAPKYEAILFKENDIPYNFIDSAVAVRFVNLSPNSPSVNINIANAPGISIASGLNYKQQSEFKYYPVKKIVPPNTVTFEVRNAETNVLLTSYTIPTAAVAPYTTVSISMARFRSLTLAIKGLSGTFSGTNSYNIFPIPHYY